MKSDADKIKLVFPNAEKGRLFFTKQSILLEENFGFTPENTHFSEGGCSDEINEPEYLLMQHYWGERFKFGGLAGYCHGGKTGIYALSHHVPEIEGKKNLLIVGGPHIGFHNGVWGKCIRLGHKVATSSCGSIAEIMKSDFHDLKSKNPDPLDLQQHTVSQILRPYLKRCSEEGKQLDILEATIFMLDKIDSDLSSIITELKDYFKGQIALLTGITINTNSGNYFSPSIIKII